MIEKFEDILNSPNFKSYVVFIQIKSIKRKIINENICFAKISNEAERLYKRDFEYLANLVLKR